MGLGKTLQTIALLLWAKNKSKRKLNLVVAPTSVVPTGSVRSRSSRPALKTVVWQGPDRQDLRPELDDADVMITSYALLRRDEELLQSLGLALRDPRRGAAHQEPDERHGACGQEAQERPPARADGHADREPPERDLVDHRLRLAGSARAR